MLEDAEDKEGQITKFQAKELHCWLCFATSEIGKWKNRPFSNESRSMIQIFPPISFRLVKTANLWKMDWRNLVNNFRKRFEKRTQNFCIAWRSFKRNWPKQKIPVQLAKLPKNYYILSYFLKSPEIKAKWLHQSWINVISQWFTIKSKVKYSSVVLSNTSKPLPA